MTDETAGRTYVLAQICLLGLLALDAWRGLRRATGAGRAAGVLAATAGGTTVLLAAASLGRELRAEPAPSPQAELRTGGAYARVRHPMYAGLLLGAAGLVLVAGRPRSVVLWGALLAVLLRKIGLEERLLSERFAGYAAYAERTPRLLPRVVRTW